MSETKPLSKQNKYDNSHKEAKKAQRQITNWLKAAEKEQSTGLPIGRKVKGDEKELQQRIYAAARTAKVDCLARARTFLREFNEARNAPTPPLSDPISSGEATPREEAQAVPPPIAFPTPNFLNATQLRKLDSHAP